MAENTHTAEQITAFLNELKTQTDRGVAVIAAAVLDELLQMLLVARFIKLGSERKDTLFNKIGAPLSSMSAKIELAFAVGVLSNEARLGLHLIRDVRNKFAHRIEPLSFDHPEVAELMRTRASASVNKMPTSVRDRFLALFQGMSVVLYGTLAADIRLKSIEETHPVHTINVVIEALKAAGGLPAQESPVTMMARDLGKPKPE